VPELLNLILGQALHKIRKHLAEGGSIVGHNRSSFGEMA
jgi:hypothetical protein